LCAHAGIGDSLLLSWEGISANEALGQAPAVTKLVGKEYLCPHYADLARYLLDKEQMKDYFEYPEMEARVTALLLQNEVPFPIIFAKQMKLSVQNRGKPVKELCRDCDTTFRACKNLYGNPWYDTIRYSYSMPDPQGNDKDYLAYGRCVCFLKDGSGVYSVILRCYNPYIEQVALGGKQPFRHVADTLDHVAQLVPLHLAAVKEAYSYMWVKEEAIVNGGFILEDPTVMNKHWVQQGYREGCKFQEFNGGA
jgi:hypothetical protein